MSKPAYYKERIYFSEDDSRELIDRNQEAIVSLLAQNGAVGIVGVFYEEGFPLYFISHFMLANIGYTYQEFIEATGGKYLNSVYEKDRKELMQALNGEKNMVYQYRLHHRNGETIWVSSINRDSVTIDGRRLRIASIRTIDEVHHRKMELLDTLGREYERIAYINVKNRTFEWVKQLHADPGEYSNGSLEDLHIYFHEYIKKYVHPEDEELPNLLKRLAGLSEEELKQGGNFQEVYRCRVGRQYQWMEICASFGGSYIYDTAYLILGIRNVDARMRKELETNQLLTISLERARRSNMAKRDFLSKMSHDLRTPLNTILSIAELAHRAESLEQMEEYFSVVKAAGGHLQRLVDEILDMSEIESGNVMLEQQAFVLEDFIRELLGMALAGQEGRGQRIRTVNRIIHRMVMGDEEKLRKILFNLLSNAMKYSPDQAEIRLEVVELPQLRTGYGQYQFSVIDKGIGIDASMQDKIFEAFEGVEDPRTSQVSDVGLGLAIVKNLVELLHGTIRLESMPGKGSRFTVNLEMKLIEEEDGDEALPEEKDLKGMRLLLVEDNEVNREIAAEILTEKGILVDEAVNGAEAVEYFAKQGRGYYDVIFMDIQMPVMNGYEAARRIRAQKELGGDKVPIVAVTADAFREDVKLAGQAGMNAHLKKPLDFEEVYRTLAGYKK